MGSNSATIAASSDPTYQVSKGETITAWIVSALISADFPGVAALAEDRVDYRFINGFVDVGDLPCRKAFWAEMVGRAIEPAHGWPEARLNLPGTNRRVEFTGFWHTPTHIRRWLKGTFRCQAARKLNLRLSTCGGVRIWVNGTEQVRFEPFRRNVESACDVTLTLEAGDNEILLHTEDLAERDTIWFFELELLDEAPLTTVLPVALDHEEVGRLAALVRDVRPGRDVFVDQALEIVFDTPPGRDLPVLVEVVSHGHDRAVLARAEALLKSAETRLSIAETRGLPDGYHAVRLTIGSGAGTVTRVIDAAFLSQASPGASASSIEARKQAALAYSARFGAERIGRVLAMLATGDDDEATIDRIVAATLRSIDRREDCSDFAMVPLLWLLGGYGHRLAPDTAENIRQAVLGYRYWVDEPGNDVMWFWSENHVLCFHVSQLLAGEYLPDAVFTTSGRTGRQQAQLAGARLSRWFDAVEAHGLAEWNSAAYYPIDFIGLMALEHWAEPELAARARHQLDLIFEMIALHTLAGVPAGSQGRAYDKELRAGPLTELAPFAEVAFGEGWLNGGVASLPMFCCSNYAPPAHLEGFARLEPGRAIEARYAQGLDSGKLVLFKNEAAQLSTVVDHKTGRKGHQQHVIDIRLSGHPMARLWVNHPGEDDPWGTQRPSYWAGSGMLPRVAQDRDLALMIFDTDDHRNGWSHAYLGRGGLDEVLLEGKWLLVRSGAGFAALHATNGLEMVSKGATAGREVRSEGRRAGWVAAIGCGDGADFALFRERILATAVTFDPHGRVLAVTPPDRPELRLAYEGPFSIGGRPMAFDHTQPKPEITFDSAAPGRDPAPLFYSRVEPCR
ncbi:hypothetical protein SJ05684_b42260 (plasmid) [Sinorhizobium sojae CCBAU 05684]|uniref:Uncharacterized protein n=1 Tax=Sinorhizobium sojae CCBAU 05684 TaxID=716928 RepID=A0A249PH10_9HYPH|nr:hypothetical protein [Sinorhizobium sojae]ASY65208.1 hypothetical protein SJ05684_b42260 [Sinorhizobium sojae CCBAU 05684]